MWWHPPTRRRVSSSPDVAPSENEFHALFRPVGEEFISVVKARIEKDEISGNNAVDAIIEKDGGDVADEGTAGVRHSQH